LRPRLATLSAAAVALIAVAVPRAAAARETTDLVVLVNGNNINGEIMGLSRGKLDYKTDDAGRLSIEWLKVVRATSTFTYEVETTAGVKRYSPLYAPDGDERGVVQLHDGTRIPVSEIVSLVPIDAAFFSRLSAYFDLGFTLAKANMALTLNTDGFVGYRGERLGTSIQFNLYLQGTNGTPAASSATIQWMGDLYFGRWTATIGAAAQENAELDLKLRLILLGGARYSAIQTNVMELLATAGLAGIREQYTTGDPRWYLAGYLAGSWSVFRYDSPKLDAQVDLAAYPYLTDFGRVLLQGGIRVTYEVFLDFNTGLNFTDTYDTRPPEGGVNNDFNLSITIGWSYRR
jgi:Protein of unknown function, DUF481